MAEHGQITCSGLTDGVIRLTAGGGLAPYMFSIDGAPFQLSGDFTGLAAGTYLFELRDANGCSSDTALTITEPLPFSAVIDNTVDVTCNGDNLALYSLITAYSRIVNIHVHTAVTVNSGIGY